LGKFTVRQSPFDNLDQHLDECDPSGTTLRKLTLPATEARVAFSDPDFMGINNSIIYPGLDGNASAATPMLLLEQQRTPGAPQRDRLARINRSAALRQATKQASPSMTSPQEAPMIAAIRRPQVSILGSAEPGSLAYTRAGEAGSMLAKLGITVISGCGSPATRVAAERAVSSGGIVLSIVPPDEMPPADWPATVVVPCGMGDARNLLMALSCDACIVIGGRAGTISEVCLAWLHRRPLLPLVGCGGWSDGLPDHPPDERQNSPILPWATVEELRAQLTALALVPNDPLMSRV
jgi:uncharacterized protein (TIGR00725 family)